MKYLDSPITVFSSATCKTGKTDTLRNFLLLNGAESTEIIKKIRENTEDKPRIAELKIGLPCATISGTFRQRKNSELINHSGLIAIDIDAKENPFIQDWELLKADLSNCPNILYAGLSCSGNGMFAIIPISHPDKHEMQFDALFQVFETIGISLDSSCRDITRLRFKSYDPDPFINENATPFNGVLRPQRKKRSNSSTLTNNRRFEALVGLIQTKQVDITGEYGDWVRVGFAIATEYGEHGRTAFHTVSKYHPDYDDERCDKQYSECLKSNKGKITINSFFEIAKKHNMILNH